jgi:hypothetical protein
MCHVRVYVGVFIQSAVVVGLETYKLHGIKRGMEEFDERKELN